MSDAGASSDVVLGAGGALLLLLRFVAPWVDRLIDARERRLLRAELGTATRLDAAMLEVARLRSALEQERRRRVVAEVVLLFARASQRRSVNELDPAPPKGETGPSASRDAD